VPSLVGEREGLIKVGQNGVGGDVISNVWGEGGHSILLRPRGSTVNQTGGPAQQSFSGGGSWSRSDLKVSKATG